MRKLCMLTGAVMFISTLEAYWISSNLNAANVWKIEYLNRLQQEKVDQSYINAYLQHWD